MRLRMPAVAAAIFALLVMPADASLADQNSKELKDSRREAAARELLARADSAHSPPQTRCSLGR